jgi:hypothetical protein
VDAIHAIECLDPERGRLIVAGDHLQLGPVIMGDYPSSERAFNPTGSVMKNLMRRRDNTPVSLHWVEGSAAMDIGPCTSQLQDNFRMVRNRGLDSISVGSLLRSLTHSLHLVIVRTGNWERLCKRSTVPPIR